MMNDDRGLKRARNARDDEMGKAKPAAMELVPVEFVRGASAPGRGASGARFWPRGLFA
jgi:hypothetical protein